MSVFHFGFGKGRVSITREKRIDRALKRIAPNVTFYAVSLPDGPRYWFSGPNMGFPFDKNLAEDVLQKLCAAKLWPIA